MDDTEFRQKQRRNVWRHININCTSDLFCQLSIAKQKNLSAHVHFDEFFESIIIDTCEHLKITRFDLDCLNRQHLDSLILVATETVKQYNESVVTDTKKSTSSYSI